VIGPIAGAEMTSLWGAPGFLGYLSLVGLLTVLFTLWRILRGAGLPLSSQGNYVPVPRTSPVANALDPRTTEDSETLQPINS
jgi:hypothetical protein